MKKPSVLARARTALEVYRHGYPERAIKAAPFRWSSYTGGKIAWHLINYESYCKEGFAGNAVIYAAIMYKVRALMTAPLRAYKGDPDYPEALPPTHRLAKMCARPNSYQSGTEFQNLNDVYLNLDGNCYIFKDRENKQLIPLRPDRVFIIPGKNKTPAGILSFLYVPEGVDPKDGTPVFEEDMIHIKLPNPWDSLEGMGYGLAPLSSGARSADVDNMVTKFLNKFFESGTMLSGLLKFKQPLEDETVDLISARWKKQYAGWDKWVLPGILDRDGEYERLGMTFEEMGFTELDGRNESRIMAPFGVPPILIGTKLGLDRSTYSNYGEARTAVWEDTLVPELRLFEVEYQHHLGTGGAFVQFDLSRVPALQKDIPPLVNAALQLWKMGVPANQALRGVGLSIGNVPGGDVPHPALGLNAGSEGGFGQVTADGTGEGGTVNPPRAPQKALEPGDLLEFAEELFRPMERM